MKVLTVVGARPQFIKAAPVSKAIRAHHEEFLLHTGQHYDAGMSDVFFEELGIPTPAANLGVGSGSHGQQTAAMLDGIERILLSEKPDWVLLYGDTNSTIAGALAAAKLQIKVAHIEAGLRSFNRSMPEEINRVLTDHVSDLLFCPTQTAIDNLKNEGITRGVHHVGDVMIDALRMARERLHNATVLQDHNLQKDAFYLVTLHRPANTDSGAALKGIIQAFAELNERVVLPAHPRLVAALAREDLKMPENVLQIQPASYLNMVALMDAAQIVITDSGGLQKEAYALRRQCVTVRPETEWVETISAGWNRLAEPNPLSIQARVSEALNAQPDAHPTFYGDGNAADQIVNLLYE